MIRVLALNSDQDGVGYHRILTNLSINDDEIKIDVRFLTDYTLPLIDPNYLKDYNIIIYNKVIAFNDKKIEDHFYNTCNSLGIKIIYDIDDYYILDPTHPNYKRWKENRSQEIIENSIRRADVVTTTTPIFAEKLRELNKEVYIIPNSINLDEQQWKYNKIKSDKIRFLWGGGISHMVDLNLLKQEFKKFDKEFLDKAQFVMCGYDLRMRLDNGVIIKDNPLNNAWTKFENIFSNDGKYITSKEHRTYLQNSSNFDNDINYGRNETFINEFYQRRHTKPILLYGTMYREADVTIAPLKNNLSFNYYKSQLKLVESGAHKCPIIMSNYGPYTVDDIEGKKDGKQKGWLIDESTGNWYEKMKWYTQNPSAIVDHGENAYEYVKENYSSDVINKKKIELFKELVGRDKK